MNKWLLFLLLCLLPAVFPAQNYLSTPAIDSLLLELPKAKTDTNKVLLLDLISFSYSKINPDEGLRYALMAKELSGQLEWKKGTAAAYSDLGVNYEAKSDHAKALANDLTALKLYEELHLTRSASGVLANIGLLYLAQADYPKALEFSFKALNIEEDYHDNEKRAIIQENIGTIYMQQEKYPEAMDYYSKALKIHEAIKNDAGIARISGNIGIIYDAQGDYNKALEFHMKALETNKREGRKVASQINLANIGNAFAHLKNFSKALVYHMEALRISRELGMKNDIAVNLGNIGETYFFIASDTTGKIMSDSLVLNSKAANLRQAIWFLGQSAALCESIKFFGPLIEFNQYLSEAYVLSGNYKAAFETYVKNAAHKEAIFSEQNSLTLKNLETRRELDVKDKEIIIQNKQIRISELEIANKRNERLVFISGIVLLLIITSVVISNLVKRSTERKEALRDIARIQSHQLRGPVARIMGLAKLFNYEKPDDPVNKQLIEHIVTSVIELDEIVKKVVNKTMV